MVKCRGPVRLWFEGGAYADEHIIADYVDEPVYLCDAHHNERIKAYEGERPKGDLLFLTLARDQSFAPGRRCADEASAEPHKSERAGP